MLAGKWSGPSGNSKLFEQKVKNTMVFEDQHDNNKGRLKLINLKPNSYQK